MKLPIRPGALAGIVVFVGIALAVTLGVLQGLALGVLGLATLALLGVIALLSASVRGLSGDSPLSLDEAVGLGAPSAEEEQKRAVLRALKDLEYERSVGKISEDDYREFSARYREEARRLIARVDEALAESHALAERLLAERVAAAELPSAPQEPGSEPRLAAADGDEDPEAGDEVSTAPPNVCSACNVLNDVDARFCKGCGAALNAAPSAGKSAPPSAVREETGS
jgi:hypothetical protein